MLAIDEEEEFPRQHHLVETYGGMTDDQFRETAKQWGKGAAITTVLSLVSYTAKFFGTKIIQKGDIS